MKKVIKTKTQNEFKIPKFNWKFKRDKKGYPVPYEIFMFNEGNFEKEG